MKERALLAVIVVTVAIGVDWATKAIAPHLLAETAIYYNAKTLNMWLVVPLLSVCGALLLLVDNKLMAIGCGMVAGGWLANGFDRLLRGPVVDFIPSPPPLQVAYNVADMMLVLGVLVIIAGLCTWIRQRYASSHEERVNNGRSRFLLFIAALATIFCLDWTSKGLAPQLLGADAVVYNGRAVFWPLLPLLLLTVAYLFWLYESRQMALALGLFLGAALANCLDRLLRGPVTDFIPLHAGSRLLMLNFADLALLIASVVIVHAWLTSPTKDTEEEQAPA